MFLAIGIIFVVCGVLLAAAIAVPAALTMKRQGAPVISKGNFIYFAPTFVLFYLLLVTASAFDGAQFDLIYLVSLLGSTLDMLAFKPDSELLLPLCKAFPVYYAALALLFLASCATVILSVSSLFSRRIANAYAVRRRLKNGCDVLYGDCETALRYMSNTPGCVLVSPRIPTARFHDLLKQGVVALSCRPDADRLARRLKGAFHNVLIFRSAKQPYAAAIELFSALKERGCDLILNLEAEQDEAGIIKDKFIAEAEEERKDGCVTVSCFNRYEAMARALMAEYPITKYIPRDFYNDNFTVKDGKEINIVFVGFGKVNYQLFRMFVTQYQFAAQREGRLLSKPVNYYVIDSSKSALRNELFSYISYEFDRAFADTDFPKPDNICNLHVINEDANDVNVRRMLSGLAGEDSFTYFFVSLSDDLRDASYAQTLVRMFPESKNFRIFVRARGANAEKLARRKEGAVIYFGDDTAVCSHKGLLDDDISEYARRINLLYENINETTPGWLAEIYAMPADRRDGELKERVKNAAHRAYMRARWEKLPYIEQESNVCHSLNMPFKVYMLGFGLCAGTPQKGFRAASVEDFDRIYSNPGRADDYADTRCYFMTEPANVLAFAEHARWTAMYVLHGYRQMKKSMMKVAETQKDGVTVRSVPHKNTALKLHGCVTSYYGLRELIKFKFALLYPGEDFEALSPRDERLRSLYNIYQYDYMGLDGLHADLSAMGYTITLPE